VPTNSNATTPDVRLQPSDCQGTALSSPLLSSPPLGMPSKVIGTLGKMSDTAWWSEAPSRQSTGGSTTASSDWLPPPAMSHDMSYLPRRLERLQERRGWKQLFRHALAVPIALSTGIVVGAVLTAVLSLGMKSEPVPAPLITDHMPYALALPPSEVPLAYMMSSALDNSCLIPQLAIPEGPQTFDACGFVIKSTDEVWNLRGDVDAAIDKYFHEDYVDAGSWGRRIIGKRALREAVLSEMRAFPDIRIHITDCACRGNDNDGYKCAMPDVLTGTNTGPSAYGPPTGRYARWTGMVQSLVKRNPKTGQWQYYAEWGVHDEWALIQQLGLDFARVPHPEVNSEPLHDCVPFLRFSPAPEMDANDVAMQEAHIRAVALRRL